MEKWDELIDWDARASSEGEFFIEELRRRGARKILDVATGTGFHSIRLLKAGFEVVSADGSPEMLAKAFATGREHGFILRTVQADWRWLNRDVHGKFDAVICLGNSFTHLFNEHDRRKASRNFTPSFAMMAFLFSTSGIMTLFLTKASNPNTLTITAEKTSELNPNMLMKAWHGFAMNSPTVPIFT